jgi:hypothetical protein
MNTTVKRCLRTVSVLALVASSIGAAALGTGASPAQASGCHWSGWYTYKVVPAGAYRWLYQENDYVCPGANNEMDQLRVIKVLG